MVFGYVLFLQILRTELFFSQTKICFTFEILMISFIFCCDRRRRRGNCSSNQFCATATAVLCVGATPVFADIDGATYNLNRVRISEAISEKTRAIIPVHFAGQPADCFFYCRKFFLI